MTAVATPEPVVNRIVLDHSDRCDRCPAQAFVRATLVNGYLLFCAHHARAYDVRLREQAALIEDGTDALNIKPSPAAF